MERSGGTGAPRVVVAVDCMGADFAPEQGVRAAALALNDDAALDLCLVGSSRVLSAALGELAPAVRRRLAIEPCSDFVSMEATPAEALRHGQRSSMARALDLQREGTVQATVSAGNTGALMALTRARLGMLDGVERPALMTCFPVAGGEAWVLDLGANIGVDADRLTEFARLGSAAVGALIGRKPRVGLLNIGTEANKGPDVVREAARLCEATGIDLIGFVEGHDVFAGKANVVVCDGFAGNILLKSAEGAIEMVLGEVGRAAGRWLAGPALRRLGRDLHRRYDPSRHNGASLLGVGGIVVKSHAHASLTGLAHAIGVAAHEVRRDMLPRLKRQLWSGWESN